MRAAALESGRGAPLRHGHSRRHHGRPRGEGENERLLAPARARLLAAVPVYLELTCCVVHNVKNHGVVGPFLPPESQPSAVRRAFMTVYVAAPNGRCHGSGQNRTPLKLATKTTRLVVKGGGMMGSATLEACSSIRGAVLHGCDPCGTILARPLPVRLSIPY